MFLFRRKRRRPPPASRPDLALEIGEFFVTENGVKAIFRPPLEKLSEFYTWRSVPFGIGAARTLVGGQNPDVQNRLLTRIGLSVIEMDMLDAKIGMQGGSTPPHCCLSSIECDTDALLAWSLKLADRCPIPAVSEILRSLSSMDIQEVDGYVGTFLQ